MAQTYREAQVRRCAEHSDWHMVGSPISDGHSEEDAAVTCVSITRSCMNFSNRHSFVKHLLCLYPWLMLEIQSQLDMRLAFVESTVLLRRQS